MARPWNMAVCGSRGSEQNASTRLALLLAGRARMLRRSGVLCLAAPLLLSKMAKAAWLGPPKDATKPAAAHGVVAFQGGCYDVIYDEAGGPKGLGRLLVCPYGTPATGDVAECLEQVNRLATEKVIDKDIVVLLDCSDLVWPSPMAFRSFFPIIRERLPVAELRERTQAYAIVQRESFWIRSVVDAVLLMAQPETSPIFAKDQNEASEHLCARFESPQLS
ncbi:unnamed protein product [Symbiodinium natans]|uniref:Uncharacterized protein n=1 Tax=Symbiodinium natans TaxID=878477 RepID=A0A812KIR0_9DINO|nr:unnamed protein product [Symbiodinium natans]